MAQRSPVSEKRRAPKASESSYGVRWANPSEQYFCGGHSVASERAYRGVHRLVGTDSTSTHPTNGEGQEQAQEQGRPLGRRGRRGAQRRLRGPRRVVGRRAHEPGARAPHGDAPERRAHRRRVRQRRRGLRRVHRRADPAPRRGEGAQHRRRRRAHAGVARDARAPRTRRTLARRRHPRDRVRPDRQIPRHRRRR